MESDVLKFKKFSWLKQKARGQRQIITWKSTEAVYIKTQWWGCHKKIDFKSPYAHTIFGFWMITSNAVQIFFDLKEGIKGKITGQYELSEQL